MLKHLLKVVWNRKKWNALVLLEIFLSFAVLFVLCGMGLDFARNMQHPLGVDYDDVWYLMVEYPEEWLSEENIETGTRRYNEMKAYLDNRSEVQSYGLINTPPYMGWGWNTSLTINDHEFMVNMSRVTPGLLDAFDLNLTSGRWFNDADADIEMNLAVVNQTFVDNSFPEGGGEVLGMEFEEDEEVFKIVGVVEAFRKEGELDPRRAFAFMDLKNDLSKAGWFPNVWAIEIAEGTETIFEETLLADIQRIMPEGSFRVGPMSMVRGDYFSESTLKFKVTGLIAFFLLLMVSMGLVGVLWQHVTRRTVELGVRRAKGATKNLIFNQIIGELLLVACMALLLGLVVVIQIPFLRLDNLMPQGLLVWSFLLSGSMILLLTFIAGFYPSWMATRVQPAEALHYE